MQPITSGTKQAWIDNQARPLTSEGFVEVSYRVTIPDMPNAEATDNGYIPVLPPQTAQIINGREHETVPYATLEQDLWLLNGTKCFITNGYYASLYLVFAMTDKEKGNKGISAFLVEKGWEGFSFGTKEKKMGIHGTSTYELVFEDVKVPKENLLGKLGEGYKIAMSTLDGGRVSIAAQGVGIAQGALNELLPVIHARKQFGKTIASFQNTQFKCAEMQTEIDAARLLVYRASQMHQDHEKCVKEASMAKYYATKVANDVTRMCLQLAGGIGYTREYPFERFMRDAKITEIYEGTNEIQRIIIAGEMGVR